MGLLLLFYGGVKGVLWADYSSSSDWIDYLSIYV